MTDTRSIPLSISLLSPLYVAIGPFPREGGKEGGGEGEGEGREARSEGRREERRDGKG